MPVKTLYKSRCLLFTIRLELGNGDILITAPSPGVCIRTHPLMLSLSKHGFYMNVVWPSSKPL